MYVGLSLLYFRFASCISSGPSILIHSGLMLQAFINSIYSYLPTALISISLAYLLVLIFQAILGFARSHLIIFLANKMEASLTLEYFNHILHLPLDFFTKRKSGEILSRLTDISTIKNALSRLITLQPQLQKISVASKRLGEILRL